MIVGGCFGGAVLAWDSIQGEGRAEQARAVLGSEASITLRRQAIFVIVRDMTLSIDALVAASSDDEPIAQQARIALENLTKRLGQ